MTCLVSTRDQCDYCGLPLTDNWSLPWSRARNRESHKERLEDTQTEPEYCCLGCRFAATVAADRGSEATSHRTLIRLGIAIFFTMNVMVFTMALWTQDVYDVDTGDVRANTLYELFRYLCLIFSLPVLFCLGIPLMENTWDQLQRRAFTTDVLLLTGVLAAFGYSMVSVVRGTGHVYFEVSCMVLLMVTLGRWLEATGRQRASDALSQLESLLPQVVRRSEGEKQVEVPLDQIGVGDRLRIYPGERFPVDGRILNVAVMVDEQVLTGESQPILREVGDAVLGGTLNLEGDVQVEATAGPREGSFGRLLQTIQDVRQSRGHYQRLADRVTSWFLPSVTIIALAVFIVHWQLSGIESGLLSGLSVVLIACPCALGLATPLAVWTALTESTRRHIHFRNSEAMERLAETKVICLDKTGTVTTGDPRVQTIEVQEEGQRTLIEACLRSLCETSQHAFSCAICNHLEATRESHSVSDLKVEAGFGLSAFCDLVSARVFLGNRRFLEKQNMHCPESLVTEIERAGEAGGSFSLFGWSGNVQAIILFEETIRPEAKQLLAWCKTQQITAEVLTGDHELRGKALAQSLQVPVHAGLLPDKKVQRVQFWKQQTNGVVMVGDGINDAPALTVSDIGIAMGCGADVSRDSAHICLAGNDLSHISWAIEVARATVHRIRRNLFWAFGYNSFGIALAAAGWLNPVFAAMLMVGSSLLVVSNSLRSIGVEETSNKNGQESESESMSEKAINSEVEEPVG